MGQYRYDTDTDTRYITFIPIPIPILIMPYRYWYRYRYRSHTDTDTRYWWNSIFKALTDVVLVVDISSDAVFYVWLDDDTDTSIGILIGIGIGTGMDVWAVSVSVLVWIIIVSVSVWFFVWYRYRYELYYWYVSDTDTNTRYIICEYTWYPYQYACHVSIDIGMNHQLWLVEIRRYWIFHPIRDSDSYIFGDILSFCDIVRGLEYCQSSLKWYHRKGYLSYLWYYFYLKTWLGYLWNIEIHRNIYYCCSAENSIHKQYPSLDHQSTNSDHIYTEIGEISKIWPHLSPISPKYNESSAWYQYW